MRLLVTPVLLGLTIMSMGCGEEPDMTPYMTVEAARTAITDFSGSPGDFLLPVSDELQDPTGMNLGLITDAAIAKGWKPAGFEQHEGYRIYRYAPIGD